MTYIIPDAIALRMEYQRTQRLSGRKPVRMETRNHQTHPRRQTAPAQLVRALIINPIAGAWMDPRLGTGNAGASTSYMGGMGDLGDAAQDIMDNMSESIKQKLVEQAAINSGIAAGLAISGAYTFGIGTVLAGVYALCTSLLGAKYRRETDELVQGFTEEIKARQAKCEAKITAFDQQVMREQMPAAKALALSGAPLGGMGDILDYLRDRANVVVGYGQDFVSDPFHTIKVAVMRPIKEAQGIVAQVVPAPILDIYKKVAQPIEDTGNRMYNAVEAARDTVTGRAALTKAEDAINNARPEAFKVMDENTAKILADHDSPAFRNQVTVMLAKQIRQDPNVNALINNMPHSSVTAPNVNVALPSKKLSFAPMAAAGAAVLAFGFLKG